MNDGWYVVYTKPFHEIKLARYFMDFNLDNDLDCQIYLPMTKEVKVWSDRKKTVSVPLFKNYIFVKHDESGFNNIKKMPGFVQYIRFGQYPSVVPDDQIKIIKMILAEDEFAMSQSKTLVKGDKVRIISGPMTDLEGILIKDQKNLKVAIEIKHLDRSLQVHVPMSNILKL